MLEELRVENLLLIERAELRLAPGLNVLTGETGAGKTVLAHALDLLLGGRPRAGIVRPGAAEAYVEGSFELTDALRADLGERIPDDAEELVLARRVSAEGRTRAYMNGRSATAAELRDAGGALLSFYGQHEHRKLTLAASQLEILDGFCGPEQARRRLEFAASYARERDLRSELAALRERDGARDRELDLVEWELAEIDAAAPSEPEEAELTAERERLRNLESLRLAAAGAIEAIAPESASTPVAAAPHSASRWRRRSRRPVSSVSSASLGSARSISSSSHTSRSSSRSRAPARLRSSSSSACTVRSRAYSAAKASRRAACSGPQKPSRMSSWAEASVSLRCSCWP